MSMDEGCQQCIQAMRLAEKACMEHIFQPVPEEEEGSPNHKADLPAEAAVDNALDAIAPSSSCPAAPQRRGQLGVHRRMDLGS